MELVADDIWLLPAFPHYAINVYLAGDVLIDTGTRWRHRRLFEPLKNHRPSLVALTHCHPDHQGMAAAVCRRFRIPLACHRGDVPTMQGEWPMQPVSNFLRLFGPLWAGPPHPVSRVLDEGDRVGDFTVIHSPGHTEGHVFYFREKDRVVLAGDVLANISALTGKPGLREPPRLFSVDPAQNRESAKKLLALQPSVVLFGHGPPLRDLATLERFVARWG